MALDLSADYLLIDDPITVTLRPKTAEGTWGAGASVTYCQRTAVTKEDAATTPAILEKDATAFHLWKAQLAGVTPKLGDKVVSATVTWLVRSVGVMDLDANGPQRYRLVCTRSTA